MKHRTPISIPGSQAAANRRYGNHTRYASREGGEDEDEDENVFAIENA